MFQVTHGSLQGHFFDIFSDFFGHSPGVFPGGSGTMERCSRDLLGVFPETFFFDIFGSVLWCLPIFFQGVLGIFEQLSFF